jgi:oxygen-independent coproporphyrinogen III oxidase
MEILKPDPSLIRKYNQAVPRYTSYPTVPFWKNEISLGDWQKRFSEQFRVNSGAEGISIYVHLPFCESLCTYCGCNKKITRDHSVENKYLDAIETEWQLYTELMNERPVIRELHLGGGTPTFFSSANLERLLKILFNDSTLHTTHEFSIEGHPNNTTIDHLKTLYSLGFRRISYGVQDLDPEVQRIINRIQPFENVERATNDAREVGFSSVNFDLIYGLPKQTLQSIRNTINQVIQLKPERIAFYSYAHVPWTSRVQRLFNESDLPNPEEKIQLYLTGKEMLMANGYYDVGMDHFSLPDDDLYTAKQSGRLHRNFMGYTPQNTGMLLGLGVSAISDLGNAFAQNDKTLHNYYEAMNADKLAVKRGFFLNEEDKAFRKYILDIACRGQTQFQDKHLSLIKEFSFPKLQAMFADGLVEYDEKGLQLTSMGHYFIRNVCSAFDLHLLRNQLILEQQTFSRAI